MLLSELLNPLEFGAFEQKAVENTVVPEIIFLSMAVKISDGTPRLARAIDDVFFHTWLATYPNREAGVTVLDVMEHFAKRESRLERRRLKLRSLPPNEGFFVAKE